jgi:hypothetical protein
LATREAGEVKVQGEAEAAQDHQDGAWVDSESPWLAKLERAHSHIEELSRVLREFEARRPWRIERAAGRTDNEWAYVLRFDLQVPASVATIVGDAIHNMRSALDAFAYGMAIRHIGEDTLTKQEIQAIQFPIQRSPQEFDEFFDDKRRQRLYGDREKLAMRCVQPFAISEEARMLGVDIQESPELQFATDEIQRLHKLSLVDKHRRLPLVAWFPELTSWMGEADENTYELVPPARSAMYFDGAILGYFRSVSGDQPPRFDPNHEMSLALADDIYRTDLLKTLSRWHQYLLGWVFPRAIAVLQGAQKPPMLISFGPKQ